MTRIGVLADTHIPDRAKEIPQIVMDAFKGIDMIIHAGDLAELKVISELEKVCKKVIAVCGNMDYDEVREKLEEKKIIQVGKFKIGVMHGYGHPNKLVEILAKAFKDDHVDVIIFGHSHAPMNEYSNGVLFFNPGSPTDRVFSVYNSYGIIEVNDKIEAKIVRI